MALRSAMLATRPVQNITGIEMVVQQRYVAASSVKVPASTDQPVVRSKLSTSLRCHKRCSAHVSPDLESLARHDRHVIAACSAGNSQAIGIELTTSGTGPETDAQTSAEEQQSVHQSLHLPIMPLSRVKLPQETISLQLFEPRYRLLFKLAKQSSSRRFGLVLADQQQGMMESIGCLCELTHYIPVPERRRVLIVARAIGRFEIKRIVSDKPFVTAMVEEMADEAPTTFQQAADISSAAMQLWQCMQQVKDLAGKLYSHAGPLGNQVYSTEIQRWCPDRDCFAASQDQLPTGQADVFEILTKAGLLGASETTNERLTEYFTSTGQSVDEPTETQRHERFSFAVARTLDMTEEQLQELLATKGTAKRLRLMYNILVESRGYLAARSTLKDML